MPSRKIHIAPIWSLKLADLSAADFLVVKCGICGKEYRVGTHVLHERFTPYEFIKNINRMLVCKKCCSSISISQTARTAVFPRFRTSYEMHQL